MPGTTVEALSVLFAALLIGLAIDTIWRVRGDVGALIRGDAGPGSPRRLLADWWPLLATAYLAVIFVAHVAQAPLRDAADRRRRHPERRAADSAADPRHGSGAGPLGAAAGRGAGRGGGARRRGLGLRAGPAAGDPHGRHRDRSADPGRPLEPEPVRPRRARLRRSHRRRAARHRGHRAPGLDPLGPGPDGDRPAAPGGGRARRDAGRRGRRGRLAAPHPAPPLPDAPAGGHRRRWRP